MTCVKPFTIPDRWQEVQTPNWDANDSFDMVDKKGKPLANPDIYVGPEDASNYTGYNAERDKGLLIVLKADNGSKIAPSFYYPWDMEGENQGAADYRWNIANCNVQVMGFGDLFVFLFFGLTGVIGTYFLHAGHFHSGLLLPATAMGFLSTAVLNLNNMRDIQGDSRAGKRTLVVILGADRARYYHLLLITGAPLALIIYTMFNYSGPFQYLFLLTLPLLLMHLIAVFRIKIPSELDPQLKRLALTTFAIVFIFGIGLIIRC
jgi:hypothetical protein